MISSDLSTNQLTVASEGRQFALIVGVNNSAKSTYLRSLLYAERDAYGMADILRKPECNFTILEPPLLGKEAHTMAIKEAVAELIDKGAQQDFLLFYFSGHAKPMKINENREDVYFVTHDFEEAKVKVMPDLYLSMSWLWRAFYQQAKANKVLLILDCCYAGKMIGAGNNPYHFDIREMVEKCLNETDEENYPDRLRLILMATRDSTSALEKDGHGFMTRLLLKALHGEVQEVLDDEGRINVILLTQYLEREMQTQPPILRIEGNSKPCILAHYPRQSARYLRETNKYRENMVLSKNDSGITSPSFFERRTQLIYGPHTQPFDHEAPSDASLADLDLAVVAEFFKKDLAQRQQDFRAGTPDQEQLVAFDFLSHSCPRYGTLLCFGLNPQKWLSGSLTRCTHWRGNTRDGGWLDDQEIRGSLLKQFEFSLSFLRRCLRFPRLIGQEGRTEQYEIPFIALEEALANALVHREYANRTDFIQIEIFDDRIEFRSPGDLPAPMTLDLLGIENKCHPRNPIIARIFYLYGYVEKVGSGIQRMQNAMKKANLPSPKIELSDAKTLTVTLYRPLQISDSPLVNATVEPGVQETQINEVCSKDVNSSTQSPSASNKGDRKYSERSKSASSGGLSSIIPIGRVMCPSCFNEISLGNCDIVSGNGSNQGTILKKASKWSPRQVFIQSLDGPRYTAENAHRRCYKCNYLLPYNIEQVPSICLAVVGDTSSGKSHYLTSLLHQIRYEWANHVSNPIQLACLTPEIEAEFIRNYYEPLYKDHKPVKGTPPAIVGNTTNSQIFVNRPLIYRIQVNHSPRRPSTTFNLMIYDASGEDFVQLGKLVQVARFALNSSALIFVADPMAMQTVYDELPRHLQATIPSHKTPDRRMPTSEALQGVMSVLKRYQGIPQGKILNDIPVAIMVSKADIFTQIIKYPFSYEKFSHPSPYSSQVDLHDIGRMDQEVRSLLVHYQQSSILNTTRSLKRVKFFATSATGTSEDTTNHFPSVHPWRCLDPILWILYELGILRPL